MPELMTGYARLFVCFTHFCAGGHVLTSASAHFSPGVHHMYAQVCSSWSILVEMPPTLFIFNLETGRPD